MFFTLSHFHTDSESSYKLVVTVRSVKAQAFKIEE